MLSKIHNVTSMLTFYIHCDINYFNGVDVVVWVIERVSRLYYKPAVAIYECYAVWICVNLCNLRKVAASIIAQTVILHHSALSLP